MSRFCRSGLGRTAQLGRLYERLLNQWPEEKIRNTHFHSLLYSRLERLKTLNPRLMGHEVQNVNALYALLDNRFVKKYQNPPGLLEPDSNPAHYKSIVLENREIITRTQSELFWVKLKSMVRWQ